MPKPHKIEVAEITTYLDNYVVWIADATTADRTQRKRLTRKGATFIVDRRYFAPDGLHRNFTPNEKEQVVHSGDDLDEAVRVYNGALVMFERIHNF